jgi:hypothetical protein
VSAIAIDAELGLVEEFAAQTADYRSAQDVVREAADRFADAVERASALREQHVATHRVLHKAGVTGIPRVEPGSLDGRTDPNGCAERFKRSLWLRW